LLLDMRALRLLGAAREAGFFATAPFIGAVVAVPTKIEGQVLQSNIKGYRGARRPSLAPFRSLSVGCHGEAEP